MSVTEDFPDLSGLQVLVVDDDNDTLELIEFILQECQVNVAKASSVAEALQVLVDWRPNLLISDVSMPGEDGYALIQKVKQLTTEQGWQLPAIALTAFAGEEERRKILAAGFQLRLAKPIDPADLITAVINSI